MSSDILERRSPRREQSEGMEMKRLMTYAAVLRTSTSKMALLVIAGAGAVAFAQEIPQPPPPVVNNEGCFTQKLKDQFTGADVDSLVCADRTIDAAFRVDIYPGGPSYLHLFDFGHARGYDAASAVFRIGENNPVFIEGYDASLTPYTTTFELSDELLGKILAQLKSGSDSFMYRIEAAPVRQVPIPRKASSMAADLLRATGMP